MSVTTTFWITELASYEETRPGQKPESMILDAAKNREELPRLGEENTYSFTVATEMSPPTSRVKKLLKNPNVEFGVNGQDQPGFWYTESKTPCDACARWVEGHGWEWTWTAEEWLYLRGLAIVRGLSTPDDDEM